MAARLVFRREGEVVVIRAADLLSPGVRRESLSSELEQSLAHGCRRVLIDLSDLRSAGPEEVGELAAAHAMFTHAGGELKCLNPSPAVEQALRAANPGKAIAIYRDEAAALRSFGASREPSPVPRAGLPPRRVWHPA